MNKSTSQSMKQISNLPSVSSVSSVPAVPSSQRMSTSTKSPSVLFLQPSQPSHPSHTANSLRSSHSSINPQPLQTSQTPQRKMSIYANPHIPDPQLQRISTSQASRQTERAEQTHYSQPPQFTEISEPPHYSQPLELAELDQMARMAGMSDMAGMAEIEQITRVAQKTDMRNMIQRKNSTYTNPNFNKDNQSTELTQPTQHAQSAQNSRRMSSVYSNSNMNQNMNDQQMLLNISSDEKFIDECNSNPSLREICKSPDIWQRRLEKYYPQLIETMKLTELNPIQFYPIATLFKRYVQLLVLEKQKSVSWEEEDPVFWKVNEVKNDFNFVQNQIAEYLQKFNFDYSLVLSLKFLNLFIFGQHNNITDLQLIKNIEKRICALKIERKSQGVDKSKLAQRVGNFYALLARFGTPEYIMSILTPNKKNVIEFYLENIEYFTNKKAVEFMQYAFTHHQYSVLTNIANIIIISLRENQIGVIEYLSTVFKTRDIQNIFTSYLAKIGTTYKNDATKIYIYMTNHDIMPIFENLIDFNIFHEFLYIVEIFAIAGIKPSINILEHFAEDVRKDYGADIIKIQNLISE